MINSNDPISSHTAPFEHLGLTFHIHCNEWSHSWVFYGVAPGYHPRDDEAVTFRVQQDGKDYNVGLHEIKNQMKKYAEDLADSMISYCDFIDNDDYIKIGERDATKKWVRKHAKARLGKDAKLYLKAINLNEALEAYEENKIILKTSDGKKNIYFIRKDAT